MNDSRNGTIPAVWPPIDRYTRGSRPVQPSHARRPGDNPLYASEASDERPRLCG